MVIRKIVEWYLDWRWGFVYEFPPPIRPTKIIADNGYHFVNKGGLETFIYRLRYFHWKVDSLLDEYFEIWKERHEKWEVWRAVDAIEREKGIVGSD